MTAPAVAPVPSERPRAADGALPWWATVLLIYAGSRVVSTLLFVAVGAAASPHARAGAHPSLLALLSAWDGQWYWLVSEQGYPAALPRTGSGDVDTNSWAFLPLYPYLVKLLALGVGPAWPPVAVLVSLLFGAGAAILLALLLRPHVGAERATFAVALFALSPLSFVLQTTYAESMGLCLTFAALCLVDRHRYLAAIPVALALAFTRPGVLALALAIALQLALRWWRARRGGPPLPGRELVAGAVLAVVTGLAGFAWSVVAALVTGIPDAYFETELAWRALWMGRGDFAYFTPWFFAGDFWFDRILHWGPVAGPVVVVLLAGAFAAALFLPAVRRLGDTVRLWLAAYALYLFAVFFPQSSLFRLLMPMAPAAGAMVPRSAAGRAGLLVASVALQALWLWCVDGQPQVYWSVP